MKYSAPYRSVAFLAAVLAIASGTLLPAAEPAQCEWVFGAGGADHDKTRGVTFDRDGNVFLASECVGDAVFGDKRHQTAGGMDMCLAKLDPAGRVLWVGSFGGGKTDRAYGVATDATGNAYVTGHFESTDAVVDGKTVPNAGSYDVFTAKFAPDGRLLWVQTAGGSGYDYGHGIAVDPRGDVVVTGAVQGPAAFGEQRIEGNGKGNAIFCAKYDAAGKLLWLRTSAGNVSGSGHGIAVDAAGNIYVGGNASGQGTFGKVAVEAKTQAALALKLAPDGEAVWVGLVPGTPSALYHEITCDSSGRVWGVGMFKGSVNVAGRTLQGDGTKDYEGLIVHLDAEGRPQWAEHLHGPGTDYCLGVATDDRGTCYVCGDFTADTVLAGQSLKTRGSGDIFLAAFDVKGTIQWVQQSGGKLNDSAYPIAYRAPDQLAIAGAFTAPAAFGTQTITKSGPSDLYGAKWKLLPTK